MKGDLAEVWAWLVCALLACATISVTASSWFFGQGLGSEHGRYVMKKGPYVTEIDQNLGRALSCVNGAMLALLISCIALGICVFVTQRSISLTQLNRSGAVSEPAYRTSTVLILCLFGFPILAFVLRMLVGG